MTSESSAHNIDVIQRRNSTSRRALRVTNEYSSSDDEHVAPQDRPPKTDKLISRKSTLQGDIDTKKFHQSDANVAHLSHLKDSQTLRVHKEQFVSKFRDLKLQSVSSSIFDSDEFKSSDYYGFYIIFWLATGYIIFAQVVHLYYDTHESPWDWPIVQTFRKDLWKVALTDLAMYLTTYTAFFVQKLVKMGYMRWTPTGWVVMGVYNVSHFVFWLYFASDRWMGFPWIAKIYLALHSLVFWMKMHSYSAYNGYLWSIYRELAFSESYLAEHYPDHTNDDATTMGTSSSVDRSGPEKPERAPTPVDPDDDVLKSLLESVAFCKFELEYQANTTVTTCSDEDHYDDVVDKFDQRSSSRFAFPRNITLGNYFMFTMFPTVVYTLHFPRTPRIRYRFLFEKVCGVFGVIALMIVVAQNFMYPLVYWAMDLQELPLKDRGLQYVLIILDMIPSMLLEYIFTFFLIWDLILNGLAELFRYADRDFYGPWWSSSDFSDFARLWNKPVHNFLLRHVYHSSIATFRVNKLQAGFITFILSSIFHEVMMYIIFGKFRGYLFLLQMFQIPLIMLGNTKFMKENRAAGILLCWVGFMTGPTLIMVTYLVF
ncbi:sterol O-acyltransferase 2 [Diutina catenulata]